METIGSKIKLSKRLKVHRQARVVTKSSGQAYSLITKETGYSLTWKLYISSSRVEMACKTLPLSASIVLTLHSTIIRLESGSGSHQLRIGTLSSAFKRLRKYLKVIQFNGLANHNSSSKIYKFQSSYAASLFQKV